MVDEKQDKYYEQTGPPVLSTNGSRQAYRWRENYGWRVRVDREDGPAHSGVADPVLSPDGQHVAYGAREAEKYRVYVDGEPSPAYEWLGAGGPQFGSEGVEFLAQRGGALFRVRMTSGRP